MSEQHTPGPWFVHGPNIGPRLHGEHGIPIMVARIAGEQVDDECAANARLISAAPEYCTARHSLFDKLKHGDAEHQSWLKDAIDAHFALADAKARGAA